MKMTRWLLLFLVSYFITACENSGSSANKENAQKQEENQLWEEVLTVHDEVMPKMSILNKLQRELKNIIVKNRVNLDPASIENITSSLRELVKADEAMMDWMQGFQQLETLQSQQSHEQILLYLEKQKTAIDEVKKRMNTTIKDGQTLLGDFDE